MNAQHPDNGAPSLLAALRFAAQKHSSQRRKDSDASPYINHPIAVAELLERIGGVTELPTLQAAILHDTLEDTQTTSDELDQQFGQEVRSLVQEVTDDKSLPKEERKRLQIEHAPRLSVRAKQIKIADKICNLIDLTSAQPVGWTLQRKRDYLDWAEKVVAGCRGCNPRLEQHFEVILTEKRRTLEAAFPEKQTEQLPPPISGNPGNQLTTDKPNNIHQTGTRASIAFLLNLVLGLFLVEAGVSLVADILRLGFGINVLGLIDGVLFLLLVVASVLIYLLSGVMRMIPKRFFIPIVVFTPAAQLAVIPLLIYHYDRVQQISLALSVFQLLFGLSILFWIQGKFRLRWPVLRQEQLPSQEFSWLSLSGFVVLNVFVVLPAVFLYLFFCGSLAVDHFSGGFLALRSGGLSIRAKTYVRDDHKTIQLIPMMHIGEAEFYHQISTSFPTNSVVLLEGVTDNKNLIKHKLSYRRAAQSLGLVEQQQEFEPEQGRLIQADIDVEQFSERTIAILNVVSVIHSDGWKVETVLKLIHESEDPRASEQIWNDLLDKRNANLLKQIKAELPDSDVIVVPWGAVHMPGIAEEIQKSGFHLAEMHEHQILHFRSVWNRLTHSRKSER